MNVIMDKQYWFKWITELQGLCQAGLAYSKNSYDIERFQRIEQIVAQMAAYCSSQPANVIQEHFQVEKGYPTPKIDVRAVILQNENILLVKERTDGLWSLPGGWIDVSESPSEAIIREVREEAGYDVKIIKLLSVWDKLKHDHPPQWPHTYKLFFYAQILSGHFEPNTEILDLGYFPLHQLPDLSVHRVTKKQLERLYQLITHPTDTQYD
ncbi:NUDIX hydrolase [Legionella longbeachae]|nr:NUDIX hydrolase [Legionella longbeachae]